MGDRFVKSPFDFAGLEKGLLFAAEHGVGDLFSSIRTPFLWLDPEGKLKFDVI